MRTTVRLFGLEHRLSKHKMTRYGRNLGRACPPGYAYAMKCWQMISSE